MADIYITGHRNPDMDSVCAALSYAYLKNATDPENNYIAVRCGHLTQSVKNIFKSFDIVPPVYMADSYPKVRDVMRKIDYVLDADEPIYNLMKIYSKDRPSAVPVFSNGEFCGLLSVDDIASWFFDDSIDSYKKYKFSCKNIEDVLEAKKIVAGSDGFTASVIAGSASAEIFEKYIAQYPNSVVVLPFDENKTDIAVKMNVPCIVFTVGTYEAYGKNYDFSAYEKNGGCVFSTKLDTSETLRRIRLASPVQTALAAQGPALDANDTFDDAKKVLINSHWRGLSVFENGKWVGFVTRRCFLTRPRYSFILVDHNESNQSIKGLDGSDVLEILDHHRIGNLRTEAPIEISSMPVGSTCTVIYEKFRNSQVKIPGDIAKVLLAGILSDTLILRSPTTAKQDVESAKELSVFAKVDDIQQFGKELFSNIPMLGSSDASESISSDFKEYEELSVRFGIGQCETTTFKDFDSYKDKYLYALEEIRIKNHLNWAMLMVTDVLREKSRLMVTAFDANAFLPYNTVCDFCYDMPSVLSRKKQLLPAVIHALDLFKQEKSNG